MLCSSSNILSSESSECVISSGLEVGSIKRLSAPLVSPFDPHPLISHSEVQSSSQPAILNSSAFRRSTVSFGLLINDEEKAARKAQEEKLREWRYNKRTAEMRAQYERDQEKEAKKSRLERDKWKKPLSKEETPSTKTEEERIKA
ncbi:hypothetical protein F2Q69_00030424 [Brassica cretica]|uniref:Uncharacterized protein n=1 Tax=Brassica cretica TaxID=69181 RepID=A0A8S9S6B9_BRACR|nr:hypothetical protein F2Q69_00030424 [Brassica cretica]